MKSPKVTVLMSVYNGEKYLREAIDSILNQTFADFEFLIVNDGSTDKTAGILKEYVQKDERIVLINNEKNLGLSMSLEKGIKLARGEYIARMDADDISLPERLEKQVKFMSEHPEIGVCGSWDKVIGTNKNNILKVATDHDTIHVHMLFTSMIPHPGAIIRRSVLDRCDPIFDHNYICSQDLDLWERLSHYTKFANIPEVLLLYRIHSNQVSNKEFVQQDESVIKISKRVLAQMGIFPDERVIKLLRYMWVKRSPFEKSQILALEQLLINIINRNKTKMLFHQETLERILTKQWFGLCYYHSRYGVWSYWIYYKSTLRKYYRPSGKDKLMFFVNCFINSIKRS